MEEYRLRYSSSAASHLTNLLSILDKLNDNVVYEITISPLTDSVSRGRKALYAKMDLLGRHLGYCSHKERRMFRVRLVEELGNEQVENLKTIEEISAKIEELHQFAIEQFNYIFPQDGNDFQIGLPKID